MISFLPLKNLLKLKNIRKSELKCNNVIGGGTFTTISKAMDNPINNGVSISAVDSICKFLQCQPGDIMQWVPDEVN